jgi:hypothetical protein
MDAHSGEGRRVFVPGNAELQAPRIHTGGFTPGGQVSVTGVWPLPEATRVVRQLVLLGGDHRPPEGARLLGCVCFASGAEQFKSLALYEAPIVAREEE